ncbi:MAG: LysR family transcriptional regulator, partial [Parabacteroides sp.]|nr:LysR family transcriptional regulator [Parabacteroides sp.]
MEADMDFKQLEAYIKTIELSGFSKAAEELFISQPSISNYISSLEKEFGTKLIIRTRKGVKLTKNGKILYEYAKNIISLKEKAFFSIKSRSGSVEGKIEIYASSVPAHYILPDIMIEFNKAYPNMRFSIIQSDTEEVISNILSQNCELGIVGSKETSNKCNYKFILSEDLVLIAPPNARIPKNGVESYIYSENFIVREEGSATRYHAEQLLKKLGIKPEKLK